MNLELKDFDEIENRLCECSIGCPSKDGEKIKCPECIKTISEHIYNHYNNKITLSKNNILG